METIKVKRSPESKGRCKLAWNKVYTAYKYNNTSKYELGKQFYPASWFTIVTDNQPKSKPVVTTDPKTGKLKVERDWSVPQAFPQGYVIPKGVRVIKIGYDDNWVKKGSVGVTKEKSYMPFIKWENEDYSLDSSKDDWSQHSYELAPLNPTDHPEHPDFGKDKAQSEPIQTTPQPTDIRDTIADYIKKYGHELTAIELIGHLTIDRP